MDSDKVEVDGEYFFAFQDVDRKLLTSAAQRCIQESSSGKPEIAEVSVYGEKNAIVGQIVCATVRLRKARDARDFQRDLRQFCRQRLQEFQIPLE
jgi:long-chain acyl-CoA synthetase